MAKHIAVVSVSAVRRVGTPSQLDHRHGDQHRHLDRDQRLIMINVSRIRDPYR
jgi:hypothetical protein